jgi:hypothetical protein
MLILCPPVAGAGDSPRLLWGSTGRPGVGADSLSAALEETEEKAAASEKLGNAFDNLRGNGTPAGYVLSRGGVVANSVSVNVDGRHMVRNRDYFIDPMSGALSFGEAISHSQTIHVSYRYREGGTAARSLVGLPFMPGLGGSSSRASFLHAYRGADAKGGLPFDTLTFGMKMDFDLGGAGLQSMYYVSDPRKGAAAQSLLEASSGKGKAAPVSDHIMVQKASADLGSSTRLELGYQDIGKNFTGFATLREQSVLAKEVVDQLEKEKGVRRLSAALQMQPSQAMPKGSPWNRLGWTRVYDSSGSMESIQLAYSTPRFGVTGFVRSVDPGFTKMASLSKSELSEIALSTIKQFDPNATLGQVTDADRAAAAKEAGLSRNMLNMHMSFSKGLTGTFSMMSLDDGKGAVDRSVFSLAAPKWQAWMAYQTIDPGFSKLGALAPREAQSFGNQSGMDQVTGGLSAKVSGLSLTGDYSNVSGETGGVTKASLGLAGKYINFKGAYQSISPTFTRVGDLADPLKKQMADERGFTRYNLALGGQLSKSLKLDSLLMRADNPSELRERRQDVLNLVYAPSDRTKLVFQHNESLHMSEGLVMSGALREIRSMEQRFKNKWFVSASYDANITQTGGAERTGTITNAQHFETDKARPSWISYDARQVQHMTGAYENSEGYSVQSLLGKSLTLSASQSSVDRGADPSEEVSKVAMKWVMGKGLNLGAEGTRRSTNFAGEGGGYLLSLGGKVSNRFGPFTNVNLTSEYGASSMSNGVSTFTRGLKLDAVWGKSVLGVEMSHLQLSNGKRPLARGYRFKTDPDPKKWYHVDLYYKDKDTGTGTLQPFRNIAADMRLSPTTQFAYTVNQYKELPNGLAELTVSRSAKLTTRIARSLNLVFDRTHNQNFQAKTDVIKSSLGLQRQAARGMVVDVYVGRDSSRTPNGSVSGTSLRLKLDRQVSVDKFLTLTGEITKWDNSNPSIGNRTSAEGRLDFRTPLAL